MSVPVRASIGRRFLLLSGLGVVGAVSFVPSLTAAAGQAPSIMALSEFVIVVSTICVAASWFGLRFADDAHLPMPLLRRLDSQSEEKHGSGGRVAIVIGAAFAVGAISLLHFFRQPNLAGSLLSRMASVFFAAGSLEIVIHLLIMSWAVRLSRGRVWVGILVAAIFFVAFHASGLAGQSWALVIASIALNGAFGLALGFLYARYGFEYALLCHGIGHILAVTLG